MESQIAQEEIKILLKIQELKVKAQILGTAGKPEELALICQSLGEELEKWQDLMKRRESWIKEGKIDLHTHSNISDAPDYVTPEELLRQAIRTNVRTIAATEHNRMEGAFALRKLERKLLDEGILVDVIPGTAELSLQLANYDAGTKRDIHILLKFADFDNSEVRDIIDKVIQVYKDGMRKILDELVEISSLDELKRVVEHKLEISDEGVKFSKQEYQIIFQAIVNLKNHLEKHEAIIRLAIKNDNLAKAMYLERIYSEEDYRLLRALTYDVWTGNSSNYFPDAIEILERIRQIDSGASIVLAHPFWHVQDTEKLVSFLAERELIDAIEVEYTYYTEEQQQELYALAEKYNLWASGGSDSHDLDKATREDGRLGSGWNNNVNLTWEMLGNLRTKKSQFHYEEAMQYYQTFMNSYERGEFDEASFNSAIEEFMKSSVIFTTDGIVPIDRYNYQAYEKIIELYNKAREYFESKETLFGND